MDFDLPLILFLLTLVTGLGWLLDTLLNGVKRKQAVAAVEAQFPALSLAEKDTHPEYSAALAAVKKLPLWAEYSKDFFPVLLLVFTLRSFLLEPFQIPSGSMIPTLAIGDYIVVNKFAYGIRLPIIKTKVVPIEDPKRGEVVVFIPPHKKQYFIKRLVGLPGDTVSVQNNILYINGQAVTQTPIGKNTSGDAPSACPNYTIAQEQLGETAHRMQTCDFASHPSREGTWQVPAGHYFMMGDNRDNSEDSRYWGVVPDENIVGKAFAIWLHWPSISSIPSFKNAGFIQ